MDTSATEHPARTRTFTSKQSGGVGGLLSVFPPGLALGGLGVLILGPLRWHTSPLVAVPVGLVIIAAALGMWRLANRLRVASLTAGPDGVTIVSDGRTRRLQWGEITRFAPGTTNATSAFRGPIQVVVAELRDGRTVPVDALKVDHGRLAAERDHERVATLCQQIEDCRPAVPSG
jgi:hypothetical protein